MKRTAVLFVALFALIVSEAAAQSNTETAYLNYQYRFTASSGFEEVEGRAFNLQPNIPGLLTFNIDSAYDYIIMLCSDSTTDGILLSVRGVNDTLDVVNTDTAYVYPEFGSRVTMVFLPEKMHGDYQFRPTMLSKAPPIDDSYYALYRKKRVY
jgi:hypothetical protein